MKLLVNQVDQAGRSFIEFIIQVRELFLFSYFTLRSGFVNRVENVRYISSVIASQIYFTGFQALPLISVLAFVTGVIFVFQGISQLVMIGGADILGTFLVASIFREASPLLVALVVVARSGTAVASELGNMKANREIDGLISMGINPYSYVVLPRLVGGIISVLGLAFFFNVVAILGGGVLAKMAKDISFEYLMNSVFYSIQPLDLLIFLLKNTMSGFVIFIICTYQGLLVQRSPHEVPQKTTRAVVQSIMYVTIINFVITAIYYLGKLGIFSAVQLW